MKVVLAWENIDIDHVGTHILVAVLTKEPEDVAAFARERTGHELVDGVVTLPSGQEITYEFEEWEVEDG